MKRCRCGRAATWLVPLALLAVCPPYVAAQTGPQGTPAAPLPAPREFPGEPVDFTSIIRLAATNNLDIAHARAVAEQARAARQRAIARGLPDLTLGSTYLNHQGRIQQTNGNILNINRDSLFVGGGPTLNLPISDALFEPLVARQLESAANAGFQRVTNDTLLSVGETYLQMMRARRALARVDDTLEFLTSEKPSDMRGKSKGLLPLLRDSVEAGGKEALQSDLARVQVEVIRRQEERRAIEQDLRVVSAELARLVRLDPKVRLWPVDDFRTPISLPGDDLSALDLETLVAMALNSRPELGENQALVRATVGRVREARNRPFLPTVNVDLAYGGFGGGPVRDTSRVVDDPFNGPIAAPITPSNEIHRFGPRTDFGISAVWRLNGLGFGNRAEVREQEAMRDQAQIRLTQMYERVAAQVTQAYESVRLTQDRVRVSHSALFDDQGAPTGPAFRSIRLNFERVRGTEGRPFEVLDSIRGFSDILDVYGQAVTEHELAKLRLLIALGLPAQAYLQTAGTPPPPPR